MSRPEVPNDIVIEVSLSWNNYIKRSPRQILNTIHRYGTSWGEAEKVWDTVERWCSAAKKSIGGTEQYRTMFKYAKFGYDNKRATHAMNTKVLYAKRMNFAELDLSELIVQDCILSDFVFIKCDLSNAVFANTALSNCRFIECNLNSTTFDSCDISKTTFFENECDIAIFSNVIASKTVWVGMTPYSWDEVYVTDSK